MFVKVLKLALGNAGLVSLGSSLLKQALGKIYKDAVGWVKVAATHDEWSSKQKFDFVAQKLLADYDSLKDWDWALKIVIEWAYGQVKGYTSKLGELG